MDINEVAGIIQDWKSLGLKTVVISGSFDIYRPELIDFISFARKKGDKLVVALNSDEFIRIKRKTNDRPIYTETVRIKQLMSNRDVDAVFVTNGGKETWIPILQPDVVVINGSTTPKNLLDVQEQNMADNRANFPNVKFWLFTLEGAQTTTQFLRKLKKIKLSN